MKTIFLTALLLILQTQAFAGTTTKPRTAKAAAESQCLTLEEQKELGAVLSEYADAVAANPECVNYWGAAACIGPFQEKVKDYLESKLMECAKETGTAAAPR